MDDFDNDNFDDDDFTVDSGVQPMIIEEFQEQNVRDIVVRGKDVYVLTASVEDDNFNGAIYFSPDLRKWNILAEFSVPALPYSLELLDNSFYVGLGNRDYLQGYADVESGSIYKVEPDEPIVILRAAFSPSKWNVEWENSKSTVEAIIYYERGGEELVDISDVDISTIQLNNKDIASKVRKISSHKKGFTGQVLRLEFKKADALRALGTISVGDIIKVTVSGNFKSGGGFRAVGQVQIIGPTPPSPPTETPPLPPSTGAPIPLDPINQSDDIIQIDEPPFIPFTLSTHET